MSTVNWLPRKIRGDTRSDCRSICAVDGTIATPWLSRARARSVSGTALSMKTLGTMRSRRHAGEIADLHRLLERKAAGGIVSNQKSDRGERVGYKFRLLCLQEADRGV